MRLLLIRHGSREFDKDREDRDQPLSEKGRGEADRLAGALRRMDLKPQVYLSSHYKHAEEMAERLKSSVSGVPPARAYSICAFTPRSATETFEEILDEAKALGADLSSTREIVLVGHEPRLSQLFTRLTSSRGRPLNRAEAVCLTAESFQDFLKGCAKVEFRLPAVDYQEEQLRPKIGSKMQVSTFLAGFTFTGLIQILERGEPCKLCQQIAAISLTAALGLFVASVYMYDRMGMPEGFWIFGERPGSRWRPSKKFADECKQQGILYAHMVWTWGFVFTPAVLLALIGFVAILLSTQDLVIWAGSLAAIVAAAVLYFVTRPRLGTD